MWIRFVLVVTCAYSLNQLSLVLGCRYIASEWSKCVGGTRYRQLTLEEGDGHHCAHHKEKMEHGCNSRPQTKNKHITKKCMYVGEWSECDPHTHKKTIKFTLEDQQDDNCPLSQSKVEKCKVPNVKKEHLSLKIKSDCKYTYSDWSECDPDSKTKHRTGRLVKGSSRCPQDDTQTKPCRVKNHKDHETLQASAVPIPHDPHHDGEVDEHHGYEHHEDGILHHETGEHHGDEEHHEGSHVQHHLIPAPHHVATGPHHVLPLHHGRPPLHHPSRHHLPREH